MARKEEILQEANARWRVNHPFIGCAKESFIEGAKWADEHPNLYNDEKYHTVRVSCLDELYRKSALYDAFLEKSCEYLRTHLWQNIDDDNDSIVESIHNITLDDFIKDFKRYLEE